MATAKKVDVKNFLLLAAEAIPALEADVADLSSKLAEAQEQLALAKRIAKITGPAPSPPQTKLDSLALVNQVLLGTEEPLSVPEIQETIRENSGRELAASTIYNHLGKGKKSGDYENEDSAWVLSEHARKQLAKTKK